MSIRNTSSMVNSHASNKVNYKVCIIYNEEAKRFSRQDAAGGGASRMYETLLHLKRKGSWWNS